MERFLTNWLTQPLFFMRTLTWFTITFTDCDWYCVELIAFTNKVEFSCFPKKTFRRPIKTFHLFKKQPHIWIQHNKTKDFWGLFLWDAEKFFFWETQYIALNPCWLFWLTFSSLPMSRFIKMPQISRKKKMKLKREPENYYFFLFRAVSSELLFN